MEIAVLIPCYNEELTVRKVVADFKRELPNAKIYVYDNNSKDRTVDYALEAGAIVRHEFRQGKGNVVRSMFRDIYADVYILVDGDDTYPAEAVHAMIQKVIDGKADMVVGDRLSNGTYTEENKRGFHDFGNNLILNLVNGIFSSKLHDIMSGYRTYNRYFVKNYPVLSQGFQIETEMTIFALTHNFMVGEEPILYRDRPEGSFSKLNTFKDGYRVLNVLSSLFKNTKPFLFFGLVSLIFIIASLIVGIPVIIEFIETHYITLVPSAILASGLAIVAFLFFVVAAILDTIVYYHRKTFEQQLNMYLYNELQNKN